MARRYDTFVAVTLAVGLALAPWRASGTPIE
jgi:hypothetical protein